MIPLQHMRNNQNFRNKRTSSMMVVLSLALCYFSPQALQAQGRLEDYKRAELIGQQIKNSVFHEPEEIRWISSNQFWYKINTKDGERYIKVDRSQKTKNDLFDRTLLSKELAKHTGEPIDAKTLALVNLRYAHSQETLHFTAFNFQWSYQVKTNKLEKLQAETARPTTTPGYWGTRPNDMVGNAVTSPDGKWEAFIKNSNVYVKPKQGGKEIQLSFDGSPGQYYAAQLMWSPNSEHVVGFRTRPGGSRTLYLIESSPIDQLQPKMHTRDYLKPGDALPQKQPVIFDIKTRKSSAVNEELIANQYSLTHMAWRSDSRAFTFEYNKRGHQVYSVVSVSTQTGEAQELIREESATFINYSGRRYRFDVADGKEIIWASERDGWNHLYLIDGVTGKIKNQITKGDWLVRKVVHVDESQRRIIFEASGLDADQDPYLIHYLSVNFDGTNLKRLTHEHANHIATFSPDYACFVDTYSRIDQPSTTVLRSIEDGSVLMELEKADISALLATGWQMPEVFTAKGRDGETDIWGMIIRPSNFDPTKKYPIIEYIYAGPHDSFVPKKFVTDSRGELHQLVELGFIVVQIDGMGTANRSKAFHDVCFQNIKDGGFPDRIKWIQAAAKKYNYMDLNRIGIFGNSAGGQNSAGALLHHPDFYKVAVSSSGCHDNRMDKMWWNEQWMGFPIGDHYAESSNVTHAHKLEGKLLLILGELDDNVDPASTLQLVNAIIQANKVVDLILIPGMGHSLGGDYGEHRRRDYFVKHLIGVDPPEWNLF
jgi:dienelactone hydrolase